MFTFFDSLEPKRKVSLLSTLNLREKEYPVLILSVNEVEVIVNTTERFINLSPPEITSLDYSEFEGHIGFSNVRKPGVGFDKAKAKFIKTDGCTCDFGLKKRNGGHIIWSIPTGKPGFGFWNVTKKCELIGRKYEIDK